jgi:hypothetical protein
MTAVNTGTPDRGLAAPPDSGEKPEAARKVLERAPGPGVFASVHALFKEARRRRRRKRLAGLAAVVLAAGAAAGLWAVTWHAAPPPGRAVTGGPGGTAGVAGRSGVTALPSVAWIDDSGRLRIGDLATGSQRIAAGIGAADQANTPLVSAGGRIYWIDTRGASLPGYGYWPFVARALNVATGTIANLAPGQAVFASPGGREVFVAWTGTSVIEIPAAGRGPSRQLTVPRGWYVPDVGPGPFDPPLAVAGGIVVQQSSLQNNPRPTGLGIWNPGTGKVAVLGEVTSADFGVIGAVTLPGSSRGLLAWIPASCGQRTGWRCIEITNTATLSSVTVRSPSGSGFALGGAFSAGGRWLAAFVSTAQGSRDAAAITRPVIVNARTGSVRVVPGARLTTGQNILWARALPGGNEFLAGGTGSSYLVTAVPLSARPLRFPRSGTSQDLNFSVVVLPAGGR